MAESEESLQLKRRARRRLVGAIALVSFVVILLPLILDKEPGPPGPPLSVQIPAQDGSGFAPRLALPDNPPAPAEQGPAAQTAAKVGMGAPEAKGLLAPKPAPAADAETKPAPATQDAERPSAGPGRDERAAGEEARAKAALNDESWVVSLDAFADKKNVAQLRAKLKTAGVKSFTEPVKTSKGELTRVRAGPYSSKEAAEKAREKLVSMGLKPGAVARQ